MIKHGLTPYLFVLNNDGMRSNVRFTARSAVTTISRRTTTVSSSTFLATTSSRAMRRVTSGATREQEAVLQGREQERARQALEGRGVHKADRIRLIEVVLQRGTRQRR